MSLVSTQRGVFAGLCFSLFVASACGDPRVDRIVVDPNPTIIRDDGGVGPASCGNGEVGDDEACDDGNTEAGDGCDAKCRIEACGNGRLDVGEACDDGNENSGDGCSDACEKESAAPCGDGVVADEEECDDGNLQEGDGCDDRCRVEACGDERLSAGEDCDPPTPGYCTPACRLVLPNCGDGMLQVEDGEECDDGNDARGDGCNYCRIECGDGVIEADIGEECDSRYNSADVCDPTTCKRVPRCGDGRIDVAVGEECDPSDGTTCVDCRRVQPPPPPTPEACVPNQTVTIRNGTFDFDVSGWNPLTRISLSHDRDHGVSERGSMLVTFSPPRELEDGIEVSGVQQCVRVQPSTSYLFRGLFQVPTYNDFVLAAASMRLHTTANCGDSGLASPGPGLQSDSDDRDWNLYERELNTAVDPRAVMITLLVRKPRNDFGAILWDDIRMRPNTDSIFCGNCEVDEGAGEQCDDGNWIGGDGCSAACRFEGCGNGTVDVGEGCDDGNVAFGDGDDTCSPGCQPKGECEACEVDSCPSLVDACMGAEGVAASGPRAGTALATLCDELRHCVRRTGCLVDPVSKPDLAPCYCGSKAPSGDCFEEGVADGLCRAEIEAAVEAESPLDVRNRLSGNATRYPLAGVVRDLANCDGTMVRSQAAQEGACIDECRIAPTCGDGRLQRRPKPSIVGLEYLSSVDANGRPVWTECQQDTKLGLPPMCWFEECDDGNAEGGDGCDEDCLVEVCGNYRVQGNEQCDDGNTEDDDGCDSRCMVEFTCGDGQLDSDFEECDPPDDDAVPCTREQYATDKTQCGCGSDCAYLYCGDGFVDGDEACDDGNDIDDDACKNDCTWTVSDDEDLCTQCLKASPDLGDFIRGFCDEFTGPVCAEILSCLIDSGCWSDGGAVSDCYCGDDVPGATCEQPSYTPVGPCAAEILEGAGDDQPSNSVVLQRFFDTLYPLGFAGQIMSQAQVVCPAECGFQ